MHNRLKTRSGTSSPDSGHDITTWRGRLRAYTHMNLTDHAYLRAIWANRHQVAPGVWRSTQPNPRQFARLKRMGVRTILNLRGEGDKSFYLFEKRECDRLSITLMNLPLNARRTLPRENYLALLNAFDQAEKPFLIHCKSGADRTGLASAMYLIHVEGKSVEEALDQLHWRFLHSRRSKAGILSYILRAYEADNAAEPISLRDWFETRYDREALAEGFKAKREGLSDER